MQNSFFKLTLTLSIIALASLGIYGFAFAGWTIGTNTTANVSGTYDSLANGLVAHYTFDGPSVTSTTVADVSGNGNTGTINGNPKPVSGKIGQGMSFDGNGDYINAGEALNLTAVKTFVYWFKTTSNNESIISNRYNFDSKNSFNIVIEPGGTLRFQITTNGTTAKSQSTISAYNDGQWHMGVAVIEGSYMYQYIDAVQAATPYNYGGGNVFDDGTESFLIASMKSSGTPAFFFTGSLDDVRIYNRALSADEITRLYNMGGSKLGVTPTDSLDAGLVGHWDFDGKNVTSTTVADTSGNGNTGTKNGSPRAVSGKIGQGMSFGGNGDYINTGTLGNFGISSDTSYVTFAGWVKSNGNGSSFEALTGTFNPPSSGTGYQIYVDGDIAGSYHKGYITFYRRDESGNARGGGVVTNTGITDGNWHFLVVQVSNSSQSVYLDNVSQTITMLYTGDANNMANFVYPLVLGARNVRGIITNYLTGSLDDVRIYNRALTTDEITRLYNMGSSKLGVTPTDSLDSGLVGHWDFDGKNVTSTTVADTSGNGNTGTRAGDAKPISGKIGQGFSFDGSGDYISGSGSSLNLNGASELSVATWIKTTTATAGLVNNGSYGNGYEIDLNSGKQVRFVINQSWNNSDISSSNAIADGQWHFVVGTLTYNGTNSIMNLYVDGVLKANKTLSPFSVTVSSTAFQIGTRNSGGTLNGSLDDVRIYNRALTQSEITRLYNMGR